MNGILQKKEKYPVTDISRLRMGCDGEGIRTLIVTQKCPLRCKYCINKYTWDGSEEPGYYTVDELYDIVSIDIPYMLATEGGITFGGGEPLMHPGLINGFRDIADQNIKIDVETSLNINTEYLEQVIDAVDTFIVDIKTTNKIKYREYTGRDLDNVINNLKLLLRKKGKESIMVRIPAIPHFTDKADQEDAKKYLEKIGISSFDLFEYITKIG